MACDAPSREFTKPLAELAGTVEERSNFHGVLCPCLCIENGPYILLCFCEQKE